MRAFDKKFGIDFFEQLPSSPGVYFFYGEGDPPIYVGKAKNLKRRLGQYRNAKRCRQSKKMQLIVSKATRISYQSCANELEAILLENRLIQELRPRWNVAGAFSFLYPMIGILWGRERVEFCYTSKPELFPDFSLHGAYRSRKITGEAFFSLMRLLTFVGHRDSALKYQTDKFSYVLGFRRLPDTWKDIWDRYWRGESIQALEELILALVENAAARRASEEVQEQINHLRRFWKHEAQALNRARKATGMTLYPVPQEERDPLFLKYRHGDLQRSDRYFTGKGQFFRESRS